jgi:hypothetical protein
MDRNAADNLTMINPNYIIRRKKWKRECVEAQLPVPE